MENNIDANNMNKIKQFNVCAFFSSFKLSKKALKKPCLELFWSVPYRDREVLYIAWYLSGVPGDHRCICYHHWVWHSTPPSAVFLIHRSLNTGRKVNPEITT